MDQRGNVAEALPERRQRDRHDVQAIEEIGAEPALLHLLFEIAIGRGDDADVDADVRRAADPLERLFLEKPQQLGLEQRHHLADFVEEQRAAVRHLDQAALLPVGAGERAPLVPEQLAFEQRLRKRRAGDIHERLAGARGLA